MTATVATLIAHKHGPVVSIEPGATVYETIERMVAHNVGSMVVVEGDALRGIFTERDYLRRIALQGRTSRETKVRDVMTTDLVTVGPEATVEECLDLMTQRKIRHLPVLDGGALVGVVSIGDCVRLIAESARGEAEQLQQFIVGGYPA
jgi:CBS domain-containing protein